MPTPYAYGYPQDQKKPLAWYGGMTETAAPPAEQPKTMNQQPPFGDPNFPYPKEPGYIPPGGPKGSGPTPGGASPGSAGGNGPISGWGGAGVGPTTPGSTGYQTPNGGLVGYYGDRMKSNGMGGDEYYGLVASTMIPIQQQQQQAQDAMLRARAATGNDAGIYGGLSDLNKNTGMAASDQMRKNVMANEQVKRQLQQEGAAGTLNLYGQEQAQTMEYLRMLGNLLGRQRAVDNQSSTSGSSAGISYNPGSL